MIPRRHARNGHKRIALRNSDSRRLTSMEMTLEDVLAQLESLGNERFRAQNKKRGAGDDQFGAPLGDIRKLAAKIKSNHPLALALWETGNFDAQLLAILLIKV